MAPDPPLASARTRAKVLILGSDDRSFLTVIRSLGRRGLEVHAGWCPRGAAALRSRYLTRIHDLPAYRPDDDGWRRALIEVLVRERYDLVIPCNDASILPLQRHREEIEAIARVYLLSDRAFEVTLDKGKTHELAGSLGIPVPEEVWVDDVEEAARAAERFGYPVVLKPRSSFSIEDLGKKHHVRRARDRAEASTHSSSMRPSGPVSLQRFHRGVGVGVEVIASGGRVLVAFQHRRVHEPLEGGGSSYRKSETPHPDLRAAVEKLLAALDYTGVAMVEFKLEPDTGSWILVEINGRFWGSLPLAVASGADFPWYLYRMLVHGEQDFPTSFRTGIHCRNLALDAAWMVQNLRADRSDPTLATRPLWQVAAEVRHVLTLRERFDTLVLDDPRPGLVACARLARSLVEKVRRGAVAALLRSRPARLVLQRRALRAVGRARTIAFVCKGNICRSPYAEARARSLLPSTVEVTSCGYYPKIGRPSPDDAVAAAAERGVDLTAHRSHGATGAALAGADVVFVFDAENHAVIRARFPWLHGRIHYLGALAPSQPLETTDPYSRGLQSFRTIYDQIDAALRAITAR